MLPKPLQTDLKKIKIYNLTSPEPTSDNPKEIIRERFNFGVYAQYLEATNHVFHTPLEKITNAAKN